VGPYFGELVERVRQLANDRKTVLIFGETGTGKELLLREYIDAQSEKATVINCGAFPAALLDSELFGHAKGAFTGAMRDRPGLIEHFACIGLDELGDASPDFQVRLLRVMEYGEYRPVGEDEIRTKKPITLIAATNRVWQIRPDLLWRFQARLYVPPLTDRRRDLVALIERHAEEIGIRHISERCLRFLLEEYPWPGNAREVRFALSEAAEKAGPEPVDMIHLPMGAYRTVATALGKPPGRIWKIDHEFAGRAERAFKVSWSAHSRARRDFWYSLLAMPERDYPEAAFRRDVSAGVNELVAVLRDAVHGLNVSFEREVIDAQTYRDAARMGEKRWFQERLTHTDQAIAQSTGLSAQAIGQRRKKLGLIRQRARKRAKRD
jgi:transcriptional regulator with GAF, ATPase, and Fis domain